MIAKTLAAVAFYVCGFFFCAMAYKGVDVAHIGLGDINTAPMFVCLFWPIFLPLRLLYLLLQFAWTIGA